MRVKNKEIRKRRQRKEQVIKAAIREAKAGVADKPEKKVAAPVEKTTAKKPAAKKETAAKKPAAEKKTAAKKSTKKAEAAE
ncbi:MAG TPA: hypothetical protein VJ835_00905 [Fimbriimonadaceae bacterium]|nr:hypothetical protein [Fimbriimonadaceae bacterium]